MACNNPPSYTILDPAAMERSVFIPFESTFCDEAAVPPTEEQQFRDRIFLARRDLTGPRCAELARRLIYMFFVASVNHGLQSPMATLPPTTRMRLEGRQHFREVEHFRFYIKHCVRPVGCSGGSLTCRPHLTQAAQRALRSACEQITRSHAEWLRARGLVFGERLWVDLTPAERTAWHQVGSPAWVRCQCVHLFRYIQEPAFNGPHRAHRTPLAAQL